MPPGMGLSIDQSPSVPSEKSKAWTALVYLLLCLVPATIASRFVRFWTEDRLGRKTTLALALLFSNQLNVAVRTDCICGLTAAAVIVESQASIALRAGVGPGTPTKEFGTLKLCAQ